MTQINVSLIKTLRERTGAGVIACKGALAATHGDLEAAVERLRAEEAAKAVQKAGRVAAEGLVSLVVEGTTGAIAELNAETDFVARTPAFQDAAAAFARIALAVGGDHELLLKARAPDGDGCVSDLIARLTARTGEHIVLRRCAVISVSQGLVAPYVHNTAAPGLGRIGVLVGLESVGLEATVRAEALHDIGHRIAMHIAACSPLWVSHADIPDQVMAEKRAELSAQAHKTGKAPAIIEKMVEGRLRKFLEEVVLGLQPFVLNPDQRVDEALHDAEQAVGAPISIKGFVRFQTGEGLDTKPASGQTIATGRNDARANS